jgi:uncharacterized protein (UPF0212 family)
MSKSESIKNDIISAIGITTISYNKLIDTIVRIYGKEKEDSVVEMSGINIQEMLNELLTSELVTLATGVTNCPNASKVLQCVYKTGEGMVYIMER